MFKLVVLLREWRHLLRFFEPHKTFEKRLCAKRSTSKAGGCSSSQGGLRASKCGVTSPTMS
eukprot:6473974-Amphidinium_carterae.1